MGGAAGEGLQPIGGPVDEGVVDEGLEQREQRLLVGAQHAQHALRARREGAVDADGDPAPQENPPPNLPENEE